MFGNTDPPILCPPVLIELKPKPARFKALSLIGR